MGNAESTPAIPWEDADRISKVLTNPLILLKILKRCDLQSVLAVKATSRFGRLCAMDALPGHAHLLPWIETDRRTADGRSAPMSTFINIFTREATPRDTFRNNFPPEARLPVRLLVQSWSADVSQFVHDYEDNIIEVHFWIPSNPTFTFGEDSFLLPRLERASFDLARSWMLDTDDLNSSIKEYFDLFARIVGASKNTVCNVSIFYERLNQFLPVHLPENLTHLAVSNQNQFEALARNSHWRRLEHLGINIRPSQGPYHSAFLNTHGGQLKQLALSQDGTNPSQSGVCQLPNLSQLTHLTLCEVLLSDNVQLPNLRKVSLAEGFDGAVGASLVRPGNEFASVRVLLYNSRAWFRPELLRDNIRGFATVFPNLSSFTFKGRSETLEYAGKIVFWYMPHLEELNFSVFLDRTLDVVKVLTGSSMSDVFVQRTEWPQFLVGRRDTIRNLQRLQSLSLGIGDLDRVGVDDLDCQYLFSAAFTQMPALHKLEFKNIRLEYEQVKTTWRNSGRELRELEITPPMGVAVEAVVLPF